MNNDDLLSFKEFEPVHDSYARGASRAEININSPKKHNPYDDNLQQQQPHHLTNDMSSSVNIFGASTDASAGNMQCSYL